MLTFKQRWYGGTMDKRFYTLAIVTALLVGMLVLSFKIGTSKAVVPGDVNGDGKVDIDDIYAAASSFGSYPGHPRWNPAADVNGDGYVSIDDIFIIASHFGQHDP
jgi:hypothetical protein